MLEENYFISECTQPFSEHLLLCICSSLPKSYTVLPKRIKCLVTGHKERVKVICELGKAGLQIIMNTWPDYKYKKLFYVVWVRVGGCVYREWEDMFLIALHACCKVALVSKKATLTKALIICEAGWNGVLPVGTTNVPLLRARVLGICMYSMYTLNVWALQLHW